MSGTTVVDPELADDDLPPPPVRRVGDVIGHRYELLSEQRRGGMGVVWRARDLELERDVSLKEIRFPEILDVNARGLLSQKLRDEATRQSRISHSGITRVLGVVDDSGIPLVVGEAITHPTLAELVSRHGPIPAEDVAEIGETLAEALLAAAEAGLHHRFLRPELVVVPPEGPVRITDFGVAALIGDDDVEPSGAVGASAAAYLAPEHRRVPAGSASSDLWSLGATLYFAVEGHPPFEAASAKDTLAAVASGRHETATRADALAPILNALLENNADRRPDLRDVPEIMRATALLLTGPPLDPSDRMFWRDPLTPPLDLMPKPPPPGAKPTPRPEESKRRHRRLGIVFGTMAIIGLLATLIASGGSQRAQRRQAQGPPQWINYKDNVTGFQISHPPAWTVRKEGTNTDFRDPLNGTALRVGFQRSPSVSPEQVWLDLEARFKAEHPSYERIRLSSTVYAGLDAAVWEFVWTDAAGKDLHNEDLAFNASGYAFALNFQSDAATWTDQRALFDRFVASFRPPS